MKVIIGIGDSWTQGQGGYPPEVWEQYNGKIDIRSPTTDRVALRPYEAVNNWVAVLCKKYMPEYSPIVLGRIGIGNRGAVRHLYLNEKNLPANISGGYLIFVLSGWDRFDFFTQSPASNYNPFHTIHPRPGEGNALNDVYYHTVWSEQAAANETLCSIIEAQNYAAAHNLKFILANAFDVRNVFNASVDALSAQLDLAEYLHNSTQVWYSSFLELLVKMDGVKATNFYQHYSSLKGPMTYLTNDLHPTIAGYELIAEEIYKFINSSTGNIT